MSKLEKSFEALHTAVENHQKAVLAEAERLRKAAADVSDGVIMPVTPCKLSADISSKSIGSFAPARDYFVTVPYTNHVAAARARLVEERKRMEALHAANLPAMENNRRVAERIKQLMTNIGVPAVTTSYGYATPRARKMTTTSKEAGYLQDLRECCRSADGYEASISALDSFARRIDEFERAAALKAADEARNREIEEVAAKKARLLRSLAYKYGVDSDIEDLLAAMFAKDRYLALSHALERNRINTNSGASLVQGALANFDVDCVEDQVLYDDIEAAVQSFTGDGRVFDASKPLVYADKDIVEDYQLLRGAGLVLML